MRLPKPTKERTWRQALKGCQLLRPRPANSTQGRARSSWRFQGSGEVSSENNHNDVTPNQFPETRSGQERHTTGYPDSIRQWGPGSTLRDTCGKAIPESSSAL